MTYLAAFLLAQTTFLVLLLITPVRLTIQFCRQGDDDLLITELWAWFGLIRLKNEVAIIDFLSDGSGTTYQLEMESQEQPVDQKNFKMTPAEFFKIQRRLHGLVKEIHHLHRLLKSFLRNIRLERFSWLTIIGTGRADETGMITGIAWSIKAVIVRFITSYLTLSTVPHFQVTPLFQETRFVTQFQCMIKFRIGHAILAGIRILLNLRKRRDVTWKSTPFKA